MKFGDMQSDVNIADGTAKNFLGNYTENAFIREGKRLYKKHPEYKYLKEDPFLNDPWNKDEGFDNDGFYCSVVYAYMIDHFLKQNPEFNEKYKEIIKERKNNWSKTHTAAIKNNIDKIYSSFNSEFFSWYSDYLREQANPGILERERQETLRKQQAIKNAREFEKWKQQYQTKQDLADGTRVVCPYCKSADTKKITVASRAVSVSLVGAASGKIGKQWHCNHCGSDF